MSVTLINGDGNPRVLASQDADWYGALTGQKTCIVPINDNLSATITDSNTIEIGSGVCITKEGRRVQIDEGDIEEIIIPTGTQGTDTYYIIGFHLYINELGQQVAETFVETMASATDTITETTFKEGSSSIYVSLYRVKRSGLLMDSVTKIIPTLKTISQINSDLSVHESAFTYNASQFNIIEKNKIQRVGNVVSFLFTCKLDATLNMNNAFINAPSGYRPSLLNMRFTCYNSTDKKAILLNHSSNGDFMFLDYGSSLPANTILQLSGTYVTNDSMPS